MAWKYIGDGSTLRGVPPADMTDEEFAECAKAFQAREGVALEKAPEFGTLYKHAGADKTSAKED